MATGTNSANKQTRFLACLVSDIYLMDSSYCIHQLIVTATVAVVMTSIWESL